ncbi:hypothetical protein EYF80_051045 [Liparis tanakae]|uniref:Uncharacterized protein n=1 Tax=Liparis tanakae TaxID=230148 RepID=A0A4Z2FC85_9TELE|nr:hypothetical protein EYF80_051045 [Liparis tanakae]
MPDGGRCWMTSTQPHGDSEHSPPEASGDFQNSSPRGPEIRGSELSVTRSGRARHLLDPLRAVRLRASPGARLAPRFQGQLVSDLVTRITTITSFSAAPINKLSDAAET